jgi:methylated-DNA-protein-cysteine methyltransferase related protein
MATQAKWKATSAKRKQAAVKPPIIKASQALHSNAQFAAIYAAVLRIPSGRVCSYGAVADLAGLPRRARLAGTALKHTPNSLRIPWHRVITSSGRLAFPVGSDAYRKQRSRLEREGVDFVGTRVDLARFGWPDRDVQLDELLWRR